MNIKITGIDINYPNNIVDDKFLMNYFNNQGKDVSHLLKTFGRSERRVVDSCDESTLSLGIKAANKVLNKCNIKGDDIDLIIFSSQFPEYTCPSQALILHNAIKASNEKNVMTFDMNVNSAGMLVAFDVASRFLKYKKRLKRALIVGSDYMTVHCDENDPSTVPVFGDAACAMIIEKTDEETGFIDSISYTDSSTYDTMLYPQCGISSLYDEEVEESKKKIRFRKPDFDCIVYRVKKSIMKVLEKNNLTMGDIKAFCFTQGSIKVRYKLIYALDIEPKKVIHVAEKFGETGSNSVFLALHDAIESGTVKRGDYVILSAFTTGFTINTVLIKY